METINFENIIKNIRSGKIIIENNEEFFITNNEKKFKIHNDNKFGKYIYIENPFNKTGLFTNYIEDAITCIRNDYGDVLKQTHFLGMKIDKVCYLIDRKLGKKYNEITIDGWKDTEFSSVFLVNGKKFDINGDAIYENTINLKITKEQLQIQSEKYIRIAKEVKQHIKEHDSLIGIEKYLEIPIVFELIDHNNLEEMIKYGSMIFSK